MKRKNLLELIANYSDYTVDDTKFLAGLCERYVDSEKKIIQIVITTLTTLMIAVVAGLFALQLYQFSMIEHDMTKQENLLQYYWESGKHESKADEYSEIISMRDELIDNHQSSEKKAVGMILGTIYTYIALVIGILTLYFWRNNRIKKALFYLSSDVLRQEDTSKNLR
ncbi:hypothetical protein [Listeria booriae]|uniref:hypothetical protein n=1 Tax=Listeria booriae TaxID=1552123 RepID=UPI001626723E|nr:hypothetical protein [Listeria booriae]MBC2173868.1 hypothetical protein [Listeria booriae]